jgi:phosphoribosyl 1,2-cyclic phosphate phosphodiesterase
MHLNLEEALQIVEELQPKRTYFTHISHLLGFHKEVSEQLPETVFLAYDNLQIEAS